MIKPSKMKKLIKYSIFFLIILLTTTGCQEDIIKNRQEDIAITGQIVTEALTDLYLSLQNMEYFYSYNQEYLNILINNNDSVKNLFSDTIKPKNDELEKYYALSKLMNRTYKAYELLTDVKIGLKKSGIREKIDKFCDKLETYNFDDKQKQTIKEIKETATAHKFDRKMVMFNLNTLFYELISKHIQFEITTIKKSFEAYDKGLKLIPNHIFDPVKVEQLVSEPFSNRNVLIKLYKLQLRDQAYKMKQDLIDRLYTLEKALGKLNSVHAEFIKQKKDKSYIDKILSDLNDMFIIEQ